MVCKTNWTKAVVTPSLHWFMAKYLQKGRNMIDWLINYGSAHTSIRRFSQTSYSQLNQWPYWYNHAAPPLYPFPFETLYQQGYSPHAYNVFISVHSWTPRFFMFSLSNSTVRFRFKIQDLSAQCFRAFTTPLSWVHQLSQGFASIEICDLSITERENIWYFQSCAYFFVSCIQFLVHDYSNIFM